MPTLKSSTLFALFILTLLSECTQIVTAPVNIVTDSDEEEDED